MWKACLRRCCSPSPSSSACWRANRSASLHWRDRWRTWCRTASSSGRRLRTLPAAAPCRLHHPVHCLKVCVWSEDAWLASSFNKWWLLLPVFVHALYVVLVQLWGPAKCSTLKTNLGRGKEFPAAPLTAAKAARRHQSRPGFQQLRVSTEGRNTTRTRKDRRKGGTTAEREVITTACCYKNVACF